MSFELLVRIRTVMTRGDTRTCLAINEAKFDVVCGYKEHL